MLDVLLSVLLITLLAVGLWHVLVVGWERHVESFTGIRDYDPDADPAPVHLITPSDGGQDSEDPR